MSKKMKMEDQQSSIEIVTESLPAEQTQKSAVQLKQKNEKRFSFIQKSVLGLTCGAMLAGVFAFMPAQPSAFAATNVQATTLSAHAPTTSKIVTSTKQVAAPNYVQIARQAAKKYGINADLFVKQIRQESGFNPNARSYAGAIGIAQFMPATARAMGVNPRDPISSLYGAARLMRDLNRQFGGNYSKALAGYNAGPGAVQYAVRRGGANWLAFTPAETRHYVRVIMGR